MTMVSDYDLGSRSSEDFQNPRHWLQRVSASRQLYAQEVGPDSATGPRNRIVAGLIGSRDQPQGIPTGQSLYGDPDSLGLTIEPPVELCDRSNWIFLSPTESPHRTYSRIEYMEDVQAIWGETRRALAPLCLEGTNPRIWIDRDLVCQSPADWSHASYVSPLSSRPEIRDRIEYLRRLEPNWDGYGAEVISESALDSCHRLLTSVFPIQEEPFLAPMCDGGIQIDWEFGSGAELMIVIPEDGKPVRYLLSSSNGAEQSGELLSVFHLQDLLLG